MSKTLLLSSVLAISLTFSACSDNRKPVKEAFVLIQPIDNSNVSGKVTFTEVPGGVKIVADIDGLKSGEHGFHIHEHGDCSGHDGSAAASHYNLTHKKHGGPDNPERHLGDFVNIVADQNGHGHYEHLDKDLNLNSIIGRSIIIHADRDDLITQPTGNSGARIACGIIEAHK